MKNKHIALVVGGMLVVCASFFVSYKAKAEDARPSWGPVQCSRHGFGDYKYCRNSFTQGSIVDSRQVYGFDISATFKGDGLTSNQKLIACLSRNYNALFEGLCTMSSLSDDTYGRVRTWPQDYLPSKSLGDDYWDAFKYTTVEASVKDADIWYNLTNYERAVRLYYLSPSAIDADGKFTVSWDAETATGGTTLQFDGPTVSLSGFVSGGAVDEDGTKGFMCTGAGTAGFRIEAKGAGAEVNGEGPTQGGVTRGVEITVECPTPTGPTPTGPTPTGPTPTGPTPTGPTPTGPTPTGPTPCIDDASVTTLQAAPATATANSTFPVSVKVTDTGNTRWYHGSGYQFVETSNNGLGLNPSYGHLAYGMYPGDTHDWSFTVTAPATPGTYTATMRMVHRGGIWDYLKPDGTTCPAPGSDIYFGQTFTITVVVSNPAGITFNVTYTLAPLNQPTIRSVDNTSCTKLTVNWDYTPNGVEEYFTILRSSTGSLGSYSQIYQTPNATPRSYQDTPPVANQSYYYIVQAHTNVGGPRESSSVPFGPTLNQPCSANLSNSSKTLLRVNGAAYTTSTVIKDGDVLTFRITLINTGSASAAINYICDTASANIINLRNLSVSGGGHGGGINASSPSCAGAAKLNVSGNLNGPNWQVTFDSTFQATSNDSYEVCSNTGDIIFNDGQNKNKLVRFGPILCKPGKGGSPNFREVAP